MTQLHVVIQVTENLDGEPTIETWAFCCESKAKDTAHALRHANEREFLAYAEEHTLEEPPERIVRVNTVTVA